MNRISQQFRQSLIVTLYKINSFKHIKAVRESLIFLVPTLVISSFATLIMEFPSETYYMAMSRFFGPSWYVFCFYLIEACNNVSPFLLAMGIAYNISDLYIGNALIGVGRYRSFVSILVTIVSYTIFSTVQFEDVFFFKGSLNGIFLAILVALLSSEIFLLLSKVRKLQMNFHFDTTNPVISKIFENLGAAMITIIFFMLLRLALTFSGNSLQENLVTILIEKFHRLYSINLRPSFLLVAVRGILMIFGISGGSEVSWLMSNVYGPADIANYQAFFIGNQVPHIITESFFTTFVFIGGFGATIGLVFASLFSHKKSNLRRLVSVGLVPSLFNINQILIFGLPLVFNPIFAIPFVITPLVLLLVSYLAIYWGFVPPIIEAASAYVPVFFSGYIATKSFSGMILQLINIIISISIYFPFVVLSERIRDTEFQISKAALIGKTQTRFIVEEHYLTFRNDGIGGVARVLSVDLLRAIHRKDLYLQYQPKVNVNTNNVIGVEALVRWNHGEYGLISPTVIIALAEEGKFVKELAFLIIEEAASCLKNWRNNGLTDISMAINLSAYELHDFSVVSKIAETLVKNSIPPHLFEVEITENMQLSFNENVSQSLNKLISLNIPLVIDDFGMGYSSVVYLNRYPISTLKIDKVLSVDAIRNKTSAIILKSLINMCEELGIKVVLEFVTSEEQTNALREYGCEIFQGYWFSKPLNAYEAFNYIVETKQTGKVIYRKD